MIAELFAESLQRHAGAEALVFRDRTVTYAQLGARARSLADSLARANVAHGSAVAVEGDFAPDSIALLVALVARPAIVVPLAPTIPEATRKDFLGVARVDWVARASGSGEIALERRGPQESHPLYETLRAAGHPGLVLFSSGTSGPSKAVVHDFERLGAKFTTPRPAFRTIPFLLFDHIGGVNTLLYALTTGSTLVIVEGRDTETVLEAVARHRVSLLPTSPTFLRLFLLSEAASRYDLSSLKVVTYGTEPMPETTLKRLHELLPGVELRQTYGLSEVGILRAKSRASDSLWMRIGGEGVETRIVDGILQIRSESAMLGYLNAPSPFTEDGFFVTGDAVETNGSDVRILGRVSDLINVGGQKVYPSEVEDVVEEVDGVAEAAVYGEKNPLTGAIVCARVRPEPGAPADLAARIKTHCRERLQPFQVPVRVAVVEQILHSERFKKRRAR